MLLSMKAHVALLLASVLGVGACRSNVNIGSNVIWSADHEAGNTDEWTLDGMGGLSVTGAESAILVAAGIGHEGSLSCLRLTTPTVGNETDASIWRQGSWTDAYFSAWYLLPRAYKTTSYWTIATFSAPDQADGGAPSAVLKLNLRTLPSGDIVLFLLDDRALYLQWPLAVPPAIVPVGSWFHVETRYRNTQSNDGGFTIWLDGRLVYEVTGRPTNTGANIRWGPSNAGMEIVPSPVEIFVDDAVISLSRVTPTARVANTNVAP